jgi:hypothetical protein
MGTKWSKRTDARLNWSAGAKRRRGHLTANGTNATKYLQQNGVERARKSCEMCGKSPATWRGEIVLLCDKCWSDIRSIIGIK